jgi:hypothetical protein
MRFLAAILLSLLALPAAAATLRPVDSPDCFAALEGVIETGDFARLSADLAGIRPQDGTNDEGHYFIPNRSVCLDSPGGSLPEAIRLAEYFFDNQYGTTVASGARCLSACAVIFMMGTEDFADYNILDRKLHVKGRLGFHRPAFSAPEREGYSAQELEKSFGIAIDATLLFTRLASRAVRRGTGPMIAIGLMEQMFAHRGQDFYYIDTVEKAGRWDIPLYGFPVPERISLREAQTACDNALNWTLGLETEGTGHLDGEFTPFWRAMIGRFEEETASPLFEVYSRADLHSVISCVVHYNTDAREYSEEGNWVSVCGAEEDYCALREGEAEGRGFRPEVIFPSSLALPQVPEFARRIAAEADARNTAWGNSDREGCLASEGNVMSVINVKEFVNVRAKPGFDARIVGQAGKHLMVEAAADGGFVIGTAQQQEACAQACRRVSEGYGDEIDPDRAVLRQCLADNVIWYKVRLPDGGAEGFVSGKFLR